MDNKLIDKQKKLTAQLERLIAERAEKLPQLEADFQNLKNNRAPAHIIEERSRRLTDWDELSLQYINSVKAELDQVTATLKEQQGAERDQARTELQSKKERALQEWLAGGGTKESFNNAWPAMEPEILREKLSINAQQRSYLTVSGL